MTSVRHNHQSAMFEKTHLVYGNFGFPSLRLCRSYLALGKAQIYLAFLSFLRNFAHKFKTLRN